MKIVFSGVRRWSDLAGVLAGIDGLTVEDGHSPVEVEEIRQEKDVLSIKVSVFGTASGEKI